VGGAVQVIPDFVGADQPLGETTLLMAGRISSKHVLAGATAARLQLGRDDMKRAVVVVSCLVASAAFPALAQDKVFVGQLVDYTGATSFGGKYYGPSVRDAVDFINANGGAAGTQIDMETVDYAYKIPDAIAN
jgi:ABC-type branched-subunit amino acid transport system substrate-binding protein